jgi:AAA15 family ATPase/GTPase
MIESLKIKNFKNLNGLEIPHLSQINLISGQNNVGKSTLLEAIAIYSNPSQIIEILEERGEYPLYKEENETERINQNTNAFSSLFTDRKDEVSENNIIEISDKENTLSIQFSYYYTSMEKDEPFGMVKKFNISNYIPETDVEDIKKVITITRQNKTVSILHLNSPIDSLNQRLVIDNDSNIIIKLNTEPIGTEYIANFFDNIALTEKEDNVIGALQIIEPNLNKLAFIAESQYRFRRPIVTLKGSNQRFPLKSMGDGINHILSIILALVNCENGCLLIDEIDNGLHYSVQENLWRVIFDLAKKLNIQVFATTHSNDCINSFTEVLKEENNASIGGFYRMQKRKSGRIELVEYNAEELSSVSEHDIEIR